MKLIDYFDGFSLSPTHGSMFLNKIGYYILMKKLKHKNAIECKMSITQINHKT